MSRSRAELLASGLVGAAETAAQFWLAGGRQVPKAAAETLMATLAWRGIASFPLHGGESAHGGSGAESADGESAHSESVDRR